MEHAQRDTYNFARRLNTSRLNPYFNGTCSKRLTEEMKRYLLGVLILILMEHAQRGEDVSNIIIVCVS